ncbi:MAG: TolC family protein [Bacteriovoracaceae bacterium]|nr:TolC family protein [Bacteriovoracaceae bacterium]
MKFLLIAIFTTLIASSAFSQMPSHELAKDSYKRRTDGKNVYIQKLKEFDFKDRFKKLSLSAAVEQGIRKSYDHNIKKLEVGNLELDWKNARDSFWFPPVSLMLQANKHVISDLKSGDPGNAPSGVFGLRLGDYKVFNWGKDYLTYLNAQSTFKRRKKIISEQRRDLKHVLVARYFELLMQKNIEKATKTQLAHASFVYRLNRQKIASGKIAKREYYQTREEYLRAQQVYHNAKTKSQVADEQMSMLLDDPPGTRYVTDEKLRHVELLTRIDEALEIAERRNSKVLDAKLQIENTNRDYKLALKQNLPLPEFSIDLGAYLHTFAGGFSDTGYQTSTLNSTNIELMASINATWTILGENGLFNKRRRERAVINNKIAKESLKKSMHHAKSSVRRLYRHILNMENQVKILRNKVINLKNLFDNTLKLYLDRKSSFHNLSHALLEMTKTQIDLEKAKHAHLKYKLQLAGSMGISDFPGNHFDDLAYKDEAK